MNELDKVLRRGALLTLLATLFTMLIASQPATASEPGPDEPSSEDEPFDPFAESVLHLGGGVEFSWTKTSVQGEELDPITTFSFEGEVGFFPMDGLKLSGLPFFTVIGADGSTTLLVGAGVGVTYYHDLGGFALFVRGRGGLLFGTTDSDASGSGSRENTTTTTASPLPSGQIAVPEATDVSEDLTGFFYGGGLGVALPVGSNVVELGVSYQGASLTFDGTLGEADGSDHGIYVRLGYVMAF